MKALRINEYGPAENLAITSIPVPEISTPTQVLVKIKVAGVNPIDTLIRSGFFQKILPVPLPATLGIDFAGVVAAVGSAVTTLEVGDSVYGKFGHPAHSNGTYAEYALLDHE